MKEIRVECRNCNNYFQVGKRNGNFTCPNCGFKEKLIILGKEGDSVEIKEKHNSS